MPRKPVAYEPDPVKRKSASKYRLEAILKKLSERDLMCGTKTTLITDDEKETNSQIVYISGKGSTILETPISASERAPRLNNDYDDPRESGIEVGKDAEYQGLLSILNNPPKD